VVTTPNFVLFLKTITPYYYLLQNLLNNLRRHPTQYKIKTIVSVKDKYIVLFINLYFIIIIIIKGYNKLTFFNNFSSERVWKSCWAIDSKVSN